MAITPPSSSRGITISSLLHPQTPEGIPRDCLPRPYAAILGSLPPTSPFHIALDYLGATDTLSEESQGGPSKEKERVLVVTGARTEMHDWLVEEDEEWMREHGGDYNVLDRLKRMDIRYCPSIAHVELLLTLLSTNLRSLGKDAQSLRHIPGVVILWDIARMLMYEDEADENLPPWREEEGVKKGVMRLKDGVLLADYMQIIATARHAVQYLSSLRPSEPPIQLLILEPHLDHLSSLPILGHVQADQPEAKLATPTRKKRISIVVGLTWMFGSEAVGVVAEDDLEGDAEEEMTRYTLRMPYRGEGKFDMRRKRCPRGDWASAAKKVHEGEDGGGVEGDPGRWTYEWC